MFRTNGLRHCSAFLLRILYALAAGRYPLCKASFPADFRGHNEQVKVGCNLCGSDGTCTVPADRAVREKYQLSHADGNCRKDFNVGLPLPWAGEKHRGSSRGDEKKAAMLRELALKFFSRSQTRSSTYSQAKECDASHWAQRRPTTALWSAQSQRHSACFIMQHVPSPWRYSASSRRP